MARHADAIAIEFIVVPYDDGRRGWRMGAGPIALIDSGLAKIIAGWGHPVTVTRMEATGSDPLRGAVELAAQVSAACRQAQADGRFPVVLSGNCIATVGAVAGVREPDTAVVWLDAHGDLNTPATSPSGFVDGMSAATLLGWCHTTEFARVAGYAPLSASRLLLVGSRALDPGEVQAIESARIDLLTPDAAADEEELQHRVESFVASTSDVYIHIDLDVMDPDEHLAANSFAEPGGLTLFTTLRVIQEIACRRRVTGLTISAYEPALDRMGLMPAAVVPMISECVLAAETRRGPDAELIQP